MFQMPKSARERAKAFGKDVFVKKLHTLLDL